MPFVHELKANDFVLNDWRTMESFPKDGSVVEVRDFPAPDGKTARAFWRNNGVVIEPGGPTEPREWRELPGEQP